MQIEVHKSCLLLWTSYLHIKAIPSTLKGKNLLPKESKFFPFRVDPFSEWDKTILTVAFLKMYPYMLIRLNLYFSKICQLKVW